MLYTKTAAARILTIATKIEAVRVLKNCIQVTYKVDRNRCSTFVSKSKFAADFVEFRKSQAIALTVEKIGNSYKVFNPNESTFNTVSASDVCTCRDYQEQVIGGMEKPRCKHAIAAFNFVQHSKLIQFGRPAPKYFKGIAIS